MHERALPQVRVVGDDAVDPLARAQTLRILVGAGIKTRADLGLGSTSGNGPLSRVAERR
jgi:hypothetical protein